MDSKALRPNSTDHATGHFRRQRITALLLIPSSVWLLILLDKSLHAPYAETLAWLTSPINAAAIVVWSVVVMSHAALGVQVVLEDYVSAISVRCWAIRGTNLIFLLLGIAALAAMGFIFLAG